MFAIQQEVLMSASQSSLESTHDLNLKLLEAAFTKFNETGERLELRYQSLLKETEELKEQLKMKDQEIKRAERLATLGETAAAIAHEVRNPLGAITLFLSLLRRDVEAMPRTISLVDQIESSIESIDHVVENILQFSRGKPLLLAPLNIHSVIREQIEGFKSRMNGQGNISCDLSGNPFIAANEVAIRQIVHNLVMNALQATKNQGCVQITVRDLRDDQLEIVISDNGPGIPDAIRSTIFDPFVTTKNEGTGLGLAIVQQLVTQHQGSIRLEDSEGTGFIIQLPRLRSAHCQRITKEEKNLSGEENL
jgi:two-component system sensor histidine kinase AtoS